MTCTHIFLTLLAWHVQIKSVAILFIVPNTSTVMDAFRFSPPDYKNSYLLNTVTIM